MPDNKLIVIADDEPHIVDMLTTFLQIRGYQVRGVHSGEDALIAVQTEQPAALLLDLMLPDLNGFQVLERLRAAPESTALPIVIVSARIDAESMSRAEKAGANGFLTKPVRMAQLIEELERVLAASNRE